MKHTKTCPKCAGKDIIVVPGRAAEYGMGNMVMAGMSLFSAVPVDRYICCSCGFTEEWIEKDHLDALKKKYK